MRSPAVAVGAFGVTVVAGLAVLLLAASDDRSDVAFTNEASSSQEVVSIAGRRTFCQRVADVPKSFDGVNIPIYSGRSTEPFALVVRDGRRGTRLGAGQGSAPPAPAFVAIQTGRVEAGRPVRVCVENRSRGRLGLYGTGEGERRVTRGTVRNGRVALIFTGESRSLLQRIPDAFGRAELFKPAWLGAWTFWLLAAGFILGVPTLLAVALRRSLGSAPTAPNGQSGRYASFRREVEPHLAPRVHRFAAPPVIAEPGSSGEPLAICIEPHEGDDAARTYASLEQQTRPPNAVIEATPTEALARTGSPWLAVVRAGDQLAPNAVERLGQAARLAPDALFITCDEDEVNRRGERERPRLRPGPSPDLLLARDLTSSLVCLRRGGWTASANGTWRYRAALSLGGPGGEGLAHVPAVLCHAPQRPRDPEAEIRAVQEALAAWGQPHATIETGPEVRRIRRPLEGEPTIEVILAFRNKPELLRRCVGSILELTTYERISLTLIDNGSDAPTTADVLALLERDPRVNSHRDDRTFNFAALNNAAAGRSEADYLLFLNNDTEIVTPTWIEDLLEEAQREVVGAVAPLLTYPDGTVQHAGAALGMHDYAGHPFAGLTPDQETPFGTASGGTRNWLAVTAACMLVERRKFEEVDGFDESFVVAGNDVDLCLRLTQAGYRSLCVPHVRLVHDESGSRGEHIDPGDFTRSEQRYGEFRTVGDPFYNPNLTLRRTDCGPRLPDEL
jgi:GT2 family glycosyltransferase